MMVIDAKFLGFDVMAHMVVVPGEGWLCEHLELELEGVDMWPYVNGKFETELDEFLQQKIEYHNYKWY